MRPRISLRGSVRSSVRPSVTIKEQPPRDASYCPSGFVLSSSGLVTKVDPATDEILEHAVLTDILGIEDYLGDMDFKIAGTKAGVTALQLDLKLETGLPLVVLQEALGASTISLMWFLSLSPLTPNATSSFLSRATRPISHCVCRSVGRSHFYF